MKELIYWKDRGEIMTFDEVIEHEKELAKEIYIEAMLCHANPDDGKLDDCIEHGKYHEQIAEWLKELKSLREYKEKMEMQYLDGIDNPLEPLKLQSAIQSEILKFNYRKEHKPQDINILDYTVMAALKYCLEEQLKAGVAND